MYCGTSEGSSTDEPGCGKSQQDDVLAQVKGLLTEAVSSQSFGLPQCWACGKRGHLKQDCWKVGRNERCAEPEPLPTSFKLVYRTGRTSVGNTGPSNNQYNPTSVVDGWMIVL